MDVKTRFLKYISIHTTSDEEGAANVPSAEREFDLAKVLRDEMIEMGLSDVTMTDHAYVYGFLPATKDMKDAKAVCLISHLDTAPDYSGENVNPQIIENYNGEDVTLPGTGAILSVSDFPELKDMKGRTLITTDGTTLLGADDKAGIAEIMTAIYELKESNKSHGPIYVCFTPDEEIGSGAALFDKELCPADFAFTVDGDYEGEVAYENFNAASAKFAIKGVNVHPGEAKDIMVNAGLIGCEIAMMLPAEETPANTEGREGFYHLIEMSGDVASANMVYIIRDHDADKFSAKKDFLKEVAAKINEKYGDGTVTLTITDSYENMISVMEKHMDVIELAKSAIRSVGLEPISRPVRGGTDGAQLSFRGLPCPNLGTGGYGFHGPFEHITVESMETVVAILKNICENPIR
ncbi:MAG: peptidase T [Lachnospiraceae bacterium]|nr:peptidase T [Lachnospiraceae bacterium]